MSRKILLRISVVVLVILAVLGLRIDHSHKSAYKDKEESVCQLSHAHAQDQDGRVNCQRPSADDPEKGGQDPNKVGCKCVRTCEKGEIVENTDPAKKCKNHCFKSKCECNNPCKETE